MTAADVPEFYPAYSNELYDTVAQFGLRRNSTLVDIGCATGLASEPFARNGIPVTGVDRSEELLAQARARLPHVTFVAGQAEALPFPDERFDIAISAQVFHRYHRAKALAEIRRVVRPGGMVAIWWKLLMGRDPVNQLRESIARDMGREPLVYGLTSGFREFYAAPFEGQIVRVLPWRSSLRVSQIVAEERASGAAEDAFGSDAEAYYSRLETELRGEGSGADPRIPLGYNQYVYLAKRS